MTIYRTADEHYSALENLAKSHENGVVLSFGVYCAITYSGDISHVYGNRDRQFLDSISNHPNMTIVVGEGGYYSPNKTECDHCLAAYSKRILRISKHQELFTNIKWRTIDKLHSKMSVFWNSDGKTSAIVGSRNMTGSDNIELSVLIEDRTTVMELLKYAMEIIQISEPVTLDNMIHSVIRNTGSTRCIDVLHQ